MISSENIAVEVEGTSVPLLKAPARKTIVVLPAYNEELSLVPLLKNIGASMALHQLEYEIVLVDDGSQDRTLEIAKSFSKNTPMRILRHVKNAGLGATIRDGLFDAVQRSGEHDIIVTMDADNSHTPGLILRMVRAIDEGCDVVVASRYEPGAQVHGVTFFRQVLSLGASILFRTILPIRGIKDYTCGYRAYRASVIKEAFEKYRNTFIEQGGFQCMVDILLKLRSMDLVFGEVPLILRYDLKDSTSKMKVMSTTLATLKLLVQRRLEF